jgi:iron complex outermembrane receptor protein
MGMIVMRGSVFLLATASALSVSAAAFAQDTGPQTVSADEAESQADASDIVVTGTLIRGQAPTGSQIVQVGQAEIKQLGVVNASQLLGTITQDVNFNNRPQVGAFQAFQTVNRPTLRYLGASNAGGSSTLLLLDGHRMPGMGIFQTTPDLDAISPGAIERIEVVTGGGSSTYGSDAVGGVMNIISRRKFDGVEIGGHFGFGEDYNQWDASVTAGHTFGNVNVWGTYSYSHNNLVRFGDRDYARNWDYIRNLPADTSCANPNVIQPISATQSVVYPITNGVPGAIPGAGNRCDNFLNRALFPESSRHSAMVGLTADLSDAITFDVRAFYAHRKSTTDNGPKTYSVIVNQAFQTSVAGNFGNLFGYDTYASSILETWGVTPQLTVKFGNDWRMVAFYNYGKGTSRFLGDGGIDSTALQAAFGTGAFNPFTASFANTPAGQTALALQTNRFSISRGIDEIHNGRVTFDGPLLSLSSGEVRVALGAEILHENYAVGSASGQIGVAAFNERRNSRTVKSLFGELSLPVVGEGNRVPFIYSFNISASGRYDHYDDFGGTFNPKVGVTWQPTQGFTLRGNWSKSFQAPSLAERNDVAPATLSAYPANYLGYPSNLTALFLYPGSTSGLMPQKATTWELGVDIRPDQIPGLAISATYYKINFKDRIGNPPFFNASVFLAQFPNNYTLGPLTSQQIQNFVNQASIGVDNAQNYVNNPGTIYALIDARSLNLSSIKTTGLDFDVSYNRPTSFGSIFAKVGGSLVLSYDVLAFNGGPTTRLKDNNVSELRLQVMAGAKVGDFTGRATLQHTSGYRVAPVAAALIQDWIGGLNVVNLAFSYDLKGEGVLDGTSLSLNVDNVFNADPPRYNGIVNTSQPGYAMFTLGRVFQFGITKKF